MCDRGDEETIILGGRAESVDRCLAPILRGLNEQGVRTIVSSCCGHGERPGVIMLADGRFITVFPGRAMYEDAMLGWAERREREAARA